MDFFPVVHLKNEHRKEVRYLGMKYSELSRPSNPENKNLLSVKKYSASEEYVRI